MAANHGFAGDVWAGIAVERVVELLMDEGVGKLLGEGDFGFQVGVDEDVAVCFDEGFVAEEEGPVFFGDIVHAIGPVRIEGFLATPDVDPVCVVGVINTGEDELFFVIAAEEVDVEVLLLFDKKVDDLLGVCSAIDVVAYKDDVVFWLRVEGFPKGEEGLEATVNVADSKCSHVLETFLPLRPTCKGSVVAVVTETSFETGFEWFLLRFPLPPFRQLDPLYRCRLR